jgi:hypothetical protein
MGLFSSRYEYFAYAGSSSLFDEDLRPDNHKQAILESSLRGLMDIPQSIVYSINTDYYARVKAMQRYAAKPPEEGGYVRGFPFARFVRIIIPDEAVIEAIERNTGNTVREEGLLRNDYGGVFDEKYFINLELQTYYGGPTGDGSLNDNMFQWENGPPERDIWCETFDTIQLPVVYNNQYVEAPNTYEFIRGLDNPDIWDPEEPGLEPAEPDLDGPTQPVFDPAQELSQYLYTVRWTYTNPETGADSGFSVPMNLIKYSPPLSGVAEPKIWLRTTYLAEGDDCPRYWAYLVGSNDDPIFEAQIEKVIRQAQFIPVAILQRDKVWFDEDPGSDLAITTNRLLKKLNLDGTEIKENFLEQESEDNASGDEQRIDAEKWDFFVHVAVPIRTKVRGSREYLFHFFDQMRSFSRWNREKYEEFLEKRQTQDPDSLFSMIQPMDELTIREGFDNGYAVDYAWSYIEKKTTQERLDDPNEFLADGVTPRPMRKRDGIIEILERADSGTLDRYQEIIDFFHGEGSPIGPVTEDPERDGYHDFVYIKYQRQEDGPDGTTEWFVDHLLIMGLSMAYKINTSENANEGYRFRYAIPELFGTEEETKEFRIPVSYPALREVGVVRREDVITDGLCATVFLVRVEKVKWYQTGFFKWLVVIIAVVLIIVAVFFPATLFAAAQLLAGATGLSVAIAGKIIAFAIGFVSAFAGSLVGGTFGQLLAVVGAIVSMGAGTSLAARGTSFFSGFSQMASFSTWGGALSFIGSVSNIASGVVSVYQTYQLEQLQEDLENFLESSREKMERLEAHYAGLLESNGQLDALSITRTLQMDQVETPEQFFSRSLRSNPGVLGYDLVNEFADVALALPDPRDTNIIEAQFESFARQRGAV